MHRAINGFNGTDIQVETSADDIWVPRGLALSNGIHDAIAQENNPVAPVGVNKVGDLAAVPNEWTPITGWTARAGFEDGTSLTETGELEVLAPMRGLTTVRLNFTYQDNTSVNIGIRVKVNGVVRRTSQYYNSWNYATLVYPIEYNYGDKVTIEARYYGKRNRWNDKSVVPGNLVATNTYVTIEKYARYNMDLAYDMSYPSAATYYQDDTYSAIGPNYGVEDSKVYDVNATTSSSGNTTTTVYKSHSWGPVFCQSRYPIPVSEDYVVNFGGSFRVRVPTEAKDSGGTKLFASNMKVRFAIWGSGKIEDEYGSQRTDEELLYYEHNYTGSGYNTVVIPELTAVAVPEKIDRIYFVATLKSRTTNEDISADFREGNFGLSGNWFFGWLNDAPLQIRVTPPDEAKTMRHPLSTTGVGWLNRKYFTNVTEPKRLTFMGEPGNSTQVSVYQSDPVTKARGTKIGDYTAAANERKQVVVSSPTGAIEIDSPTFDPTDASFTKAGNMTIPANGTQNVWTRITGFTQGYDTTTAPAGADVKVSLTVKLSDGIYPSGRKARIVINGIPKADFPAVGSTITGTWSGHVEGGDVIEFQITRNWAYSASIVATGTTMLVDYASSKVNYLVESVLPTSTYDTYDTTQTQVERIHWSRITDDTNAIEIVREEAKRSYAKVTFVSDVLADAAILKPGKRLRVLAKSGSTYAPMFTGLIREFKVKFNYAGKPAVEIVVESSQVLLDESDSFYIYDTPEETLPMLHTLGTPVVVEGVDVTGPHSSKPAGSTLPSYSSPNVKVNDSLVALRNTRKGYVWVDRYGTIRYVANRSSASVLIVGDRYEVAPMSYGKIEKGISTDSIITRVKPEEYKLNLEELGDRTTAGELPVKLEDIVSETELAEYVYSPKGERDYGEKAETFPVVRHSGNIEDIKTNNFGPSFYDWSNAILLDYDLARNTVSRIMLVPTDHAQLMQIAQLELLDVLTVLYKSERHLVRIRRMEWFVVNNAIRVEVYFDRKQGQVAWGSVIEAEVGLFTDVFYDAF